jgi:hypothetical protein
MTLDRDQLGLTPYVNVPRTMDCHQTLLEGDPGNAMVRPFEGNKANVHAIRSHGGMFIRFELMVFLLGKDLTASEA